MNNEYISVQDNLTRNRRRSLPHVIILSISRVLTKTIAFCARASAISYSGLLPPPARLELLVALALGP